MKNFIALICIFGGMALITTLVESKKRWVRFIGEAIIGAIGVALSSILAIACIGAVIALGLGVMMWLFPNVDFSEIIFSIGGLLFWFLMIIVIVVIKAWWDKRKGKQIKK